MGYYNHKRVKPGQVFVLVPQKGIGKDKKPFVIPPEKQFSDKWMEKVEADGSDEMEVVPKAKGKKMAKVVDEQASMPSEDSEVI